MTIFFLTINTLGSWDGKLGILAFPLFTILFFCYPLLAILFIRQLYLLIKEKFTDKQRLITTIALAGVLTLTFFKPNGFINFDELKGENLLIADYEGAANCRSVLKFKANNKFIDRSICFGIDEIEGGYYRKGDTLFFRNTKPTSGEKYDEFAVIKLFDSPNGIYIGHLTSYKNKKDSVGHRFDITLNKF